MSREYQQILTDVTSARNQYNIIMVFGSTNWHMAIPTGRNQSSITEVCIDYRKTGNFGES